MILTKDKSFYKNLILLAIPMVLQNLITFGVGLADNLMIGTLGDSAVSGVYIASQIQTVLQVLSTGIEGAILLLSGQYWGKRDTESIKKIISVGMRFSLGLGAVFFAVCVIVPKKVIAFFTEDESVITEGSAYLVILCFSFLFFCLTQALIASMRSVESARIGMIVSASSLVINIGLNYVLIFGKLGFPALGVTGAAIATLIARICETGVILVYTFFVDKKLKLRPRDFLTCDKGLLKDFIRYGMPIVAGQIVWGTNLFAGSAILGHFSKAVITGTSLANTVNNMMYVGMNGLSGAIGIIVSRDVGAGLSDRVKSYVHTVELIFLALGLMTSALFYVICDPFISLYSISEEAAGFSRQFIHVLCITGIGTCYECATLFGLVKSGGDVSFVLKNDAIHVFCIVLPSAIIAMTLGAPAYIVFFLLKIDQLLKCAVAFIKIRRYNWMKDLTKT